MVNLSTDAANNEAREQALAKMTADESAREATWAQLSVATSASMTAVAGNKFLRKLQAKKLGGTVSLDTSDVKRAPPTAAELAETATMARMKLRARMRQVASATRLSAPKTAVESRAEGQVLRLRLQASARASQGLGNLDRSPVSSAVRTRTARTRPAHCGLPRVLRTADSVLFAVDAATHLWGQRRENSE